MPKIPQKLIKFLDDNKIKYEIVQHKTVFTAYDKAATLKVKPSLIGKTLVLKTDKELAVALLAGNKNLDKNQFKKVLNVWTRRRQGFGGQRKKTVKSIEFVSERVMKNKFKGIKIGALPPFGNLWKLPTFIDRGLIKEKNIFVNTGIYENSFKISPKIFEKLNYIKGVFSKAKK